MAEVVDIEPGSLRATLMAMDEPELIAQQITQQGAMHALTTLCAHGCTEQVAQDMLASLRSNMLVIEAVARDEGFAPLFPEGPDGVNGIRYTSWCDEHRRATPCDKCAAGVTPCGEAQQKGGA